MPRRRFHSNDLHELSAQIRDDLAARCPCLSEEHRAVFAVQIALAELDTAAGMPIDPDLYQLAREN